ncbi:MAG: GNAT family N-acetyltransferase [Armatimonadetes bacterium]|nr:GNAT family N-acetyltransferase [Armatimonadota bacterium]
MGFTVRPVTSADDAAFVGAPMSRAFYNYVVPQRAFAHAPGGIEHWVDRMMREAIVRRILCGVPVFVAESEGIPIGAAVCDIEGVERPPEAVAIWQRLLDEIGPEAVQFFDAFSAAVDSIPFPKPNLYVSMIGVEPGWQGKGVGRSLIEAAATAARSIPGCKGLCLDTESQSNVDLYQKLGFGVVGHAQVEDIDVWGLHQPISH